MSVESYGSNKAEIAVLKAVCTIQKKSHILQGQVRLKMHGPNQNL